MQPATKEKSQQETQTKQWMKKISNMDDKTTWKKNSAKLLFYKKKLKIKNLVNQILKKIKNSGTHHQQTTHAEDSQGWRPRTMKDHIKALIKINSQV